MADPPGVLVRHLQLHLVPRTDRPLLLLLLLLLLGLLLRVFIRVLLEIGKNRIRVRVGVGVGVGVRDLVRLEIEGSKWAQMSVDVGRETRNDSGLLRLLLLSL